MKTSHEITHIGIALDLLRKARIHLGLAGAFNSRKKVQSAIKSAEGALRHNQREDIQQKRAAGVQAKRASRTPIPR